MKKLRSRKKLKKSRSALIWQSLVLTLIFFSFIAVSSSAEPDARLDIKNPPSENLLKGRRYNFIVQVENKWAVTSAHAQKLVLDINVNGDAEITAHDSGDLVTGSCSADSCHFTNNDTVKKGRQVRVKITVSIEDSGSGEVEFQADTMLTGKRPNYQLAGGEA